MADTEMLQALARLEAQVHAYREDVQKHSAEMDRRLDLMQASLERVADDQTSTRARVDRVESELRQEVHRLQDVAAEAKRVARQSVSEFADATTGMVRHLEKVEEARKAGTATHKARFDAQDAALRSLTSAVDGARRVRVWHVVAIVVAFVGASIATDLGKAWIAAQTTVTQPKKE